MRGTSSIPGDCLSLEYRLMNTPDQDTLVRAIVDARFILSELLGSVHAIQLRRWSGYGRFSTGPS